MLETDISKCFDEIDHEVMLRGVVLPKEALKGLRYAVKAGVRGEYPSSIKGTPQGGVISPLLANIALDGFEECGSNQNSRKLFGRNGRGIVRVEGVVTHPSSLSEPCMKLSPHTAPMTCGLKPTAKGRKIQLIASI